MKLEASYRITTPMFIGGANFSDLAELRPPSLKGLLRFWFRAVALPRLGTWQAVSAEEREFFGSTEGQAGLLLSVRVPEKLAVGGAGEKWERQHGLGYLGYGLLESRHQTLQTLRPYLKEGGRFTLRLIARRSVSQEQAELVKQAAIALGVFGGAGARARRGFGSLTLESLCHDGEEQWENPKTVAELRSRIRTLLSGLGLPRASGLPPYTAFGSSSKVWIADSDLDPRRLLDRLGKELLRYRSYGRAAASRPVHVLPWGEPAEHNFADDHDLVVDFLEGRRVTRHPRRVVFGLPHNYFFLSSKQKVTVEPANPDFSRRASPLFIHVHALASGEYAAVVSLIPAAFLPEGERVRLASGKRQAAVECRVNYRDIEAFFDRPAFANKVVAWP